MPPRGPTPISLIIIIIPTYFYWKNRFNRANTDDLLENKLIKIRKCHANYGYRRMVQELRRNGWLVNHKKVQRLMKKLGLLATSFWHKSRKYNSYKGTVGKVSNNKLRRRFNTTIPHQKVTTDTTEFKYYEDRVQKNFISTPIWTYLIMRLFLIVYPKRQIIKLFLKL